MLFRGHRYEENPTKKMKRKIKAAVKVKKMVQEWGECSIMSNGADRSTKISPFEVEFTGDLDKSFVSGGGGVHPH